MLAMATSLALLPRRSFLAVKDRLTDVFRVRGLAEAKCLLGMSWDEHTSRQIPEGWLGGCLE